MYECTGRSGKRVVTKRDVGKIFRVLDNSCLCCASERLEFIYKVDGGVCYFFRFNIIPPDGLKRKCCGMEIEYEKWYPSEKEAVQYVYSYERVDPLPILLLYNAQSPVGLK